RQLLKAVKRAAVFMDPDGNINLAHLKQEVSKPIMQEVSKPGHRRAHTPFNSAPFDLETDTFHSAVRVMQKAYLEGLLEQTRGNVVKAYKKAGLSKSRFYEILKELDVRYKDKELEIK